MFGLARSPLRLWTAVCLLALASPAFAQPAPAREAPRRPNFLFLLTDDQRWDALGVVQREQGDRARFPWFETPHLDRLAAEGVRFRNAFVVNSLCSPSRAAFLTGRYNHDNGIVNNHTPLPEVTRTWATALRDAGYATGYVGKWHMDGQSGKRPGFDYSASFIGQGRYFDCPIEVDGRKTETTGWVDDRSTDYAIGFLERQPKGRPFALAVGFKTSHGPFDPPDRAVGRFRDAVARPPANRDTPPPFPRNRPAAAKDAAKKAGNPNLKATNAPPPGEVQRAGVNLNYFRGLSAIDDNVGRLLQALDRLGLSGETVVIFTSDNGFYQGEHGLSDKRSAYEESIRIPLLVRDPRMDGPGRTVDAMALNIDLAPTLLDLAGVSIPAEMQGRSWRPLLEGKPTPDWRSAWLYEYFLERNFTSPTVLAVRTADAKLVRYPGHDDWTELFDLASDPYETRNLARDPAHRDLLGRMQAELDRQREAVGYHVPESADTPVAERSASLRTQP